MRDRSTDQSHSQRHVERGPAPPPLPADVGIVAALSIEAGDLIDHLKKVRKYLSVKVPIIEGEFGGKIVAVAIGGAGRSAARRAADVLIAGHRPRWIISAGFAGALNPALARNDLVLPHEVIDLEGRCFPVEQPATLGSFRHTTGRLLTVDRPIVNADEKDGALAFPPSRPGRHGVVGRRGIMRREARPVHLAPRDQRRRTHQAAERGRHAAFPYGELSRGSGHACVLEPTFQSQGFLDAV